MRSIHASRILPLVIVLSATIVACQSYNMEEVDPHTVVGVETYRKFEQLNPPTLLIVQDHSGSMDACFDPEPGMGPTSGCKELPSMADTDPNRRSRMEVARQVMIKTLHESHDDVQFGLVLFGADEVDASCGQPQTIAEPSESSWQTAMDAYGNNRYLVKPRGGTPTTVGLRRAWDMLVDPDTNTPFRTDRENFVVLVTDGLMNCNKEHATPCVCAAENGCPTGRAGEMIPYGGVGEPVESLLCLDDHAALAEVKRLRDAGVRTFVIGLGEVFGTGDGLANSTLDSLAEAGGVPRQDGSGEKFYSASDAQQLQESLDKIVKQISAPCEYELDGPVCDGRLMSIRLKIDGESVPTSCNEEEGEATWFFADHPAGGRDETRIVFSDAICAQLKAAESVEISLQGVEEACLNGDGSRREPACSLAQPAGE